MNKVRVRDVIAHDDKTFEIHQINNTNMTKSMRDVEDDAKDQILLRLRCRTEEEKDEWVKAINMEVKELKSTMKNLSRAFVFLNN